MNEGRKSVKQQIAAAVIGNALEWYDFIVYGFMTAVISKVFFPTDSAYTSLLITTATFGIGFVFRPLGGVLIGMYADRRGRREALQLILGLMALATAMIAFTPSYASIGITASLIIVTARMLQGLAAGGEFASATAFLVEAAPADKRGFYGSWQMFGQALSMLCGACVSAAVTKLMSPETLLDWGWRIPFVIGLLIAPVGYWIRKNLHETANISENRRAPTVGNTIVKNKRGLFSSFLLTSSGTCSFYVLVVYLPTYVNKTLGVPLRDCFTAQCVGIAWMMMIIPIFGAMSDRIGRQKLIGISQFAYFIAMYPCFSWLVAEPSFTTLLFVQLVLCGLFGIFLGPMSTALAEQFPRNVRSTAMAISYNLSVMTFGGFAQTLITWLLHITGSKMTPAYYLLFGAAMGIVGALLMLGKKQRQRHEQDHSLVAVVNE